MGVRMEYAAREQFGLAGRIMGVAKLITIFGGSGFVDDYPADPTADGWIIAE